MVAMSALVDVKNALRIKADAFDLEITDLINACKRDLELAGIATSLIKEDDALIKRAIIVYCKGNFGYTSDSQKYIDSYNLLKMHLSLSLDYREE